MGGPVKPDRRRVTRTRFSGGVLPPSARIHPGREVIVVDLSSRGALVEGIWRLRPGSRVDLQVGDGQAAALARGVVERCYVTALGPTEVRYRAAVRFERAIAFRPPEDLLDGYSVPTGANDDRRRRGQQLPDAG